MKCYDEMTMQALGKVLSTPTGSFLMYMYHDAKTWANRSRFALDEFHGKRPTKKKIEAQAHKSHHDGEEYAYRNTLAALVIDASGYKITRRDAIRAINDEDEQMRAGCTLTPIATLKMQSVAISASGAFYA